MATYDQIGDAYDLVYPDTGDRVPFVAKVLKNFGKQTVLELGIGSGLFAIPLTKSGLNVEGLEISEVMLDVMRKKAPDLNAYQGDIRDFSLGKQYQAVLALSSILVLLKDQQEIKRCLRCVYEHLEPEGLLLLELPNHPVEIAQSNNSQEVFSNDGNGTVVVIQSGVEGEFWTETWHILKRDGDGFSYENVLCRELICPPETLIEQIKEAGFGVIEEYGDLLGSPFDAESSWRRVLICRKNGVTA